MAAGETMDALNGEARRTSAGRLTGRGPAVLLGALALAGVALVLFTTRLGAFLMDDSYYYISPARELAAGNGFHPSYIFAPLLPLALGGFSLLGIDPLDAVRWLNALLFGVNIFLAGRLARRMGAPVGFALLAGALVLLSDVIVEAHGWAMSEALCFTFLLLSLDQAHRYLTGGRRRHVWIAALFAALTVLARYAALPVIAAIALSILVMAPLRSFWARLREAALFGAASAAPIVLYLLRNQLTAGRPVRYQNYFIEPLSQERLIGFFYNWLSLFIPGRLLRGREIMAGLLIGLAVVMVVAGAAWFYRRHWAALAAGAFRPGVFLLGAQIVSTLLMLYLARGFTELDIYNTRHLTPILLVFLILMVVLAARLWLVAGRAMRAAIALFFAVFLAYYAFRSVDYARQIAPQGLGYANITWHNSETVRYLRHHPEITDIVSTGEMGIYFWTGRKPIAMIDFRTPQALQAYLCERDAPLLIMSQMPAELYGADQKTWVRGLELAQEFNDGQMYRCAR